jgi:hypothetical protein
MYSWQDSNNEAHTVLSDCETETAWSVFPSLIVSNRWIDWHVFYLYRGQMGFRTHFHIYIDRNRIIYYHDCTVDCSMGEIFAIIL